ncbi:unnamed protein product [Mytilus coruscus]|uniref:Uncharacterized protein n=1 Tax=Mytilus coruscus TaxID=42192 RepID=A0A6J8BXL0_MYTCO|nr:unnamed protein product [Mytilus coruscus]
MTHLKNKYSLLMDKIQFENESVETKSVKSLVSSRSNKTRLSASESRAVDLRVKAESEKIKLQYVKKEVAMKKEQFEKSLQLEVLRQQKNAAAADVEASYLEKHSQCETQHGESDILPKEEISAFERTSQYLDGLSSHTKNLYQLRQNCLYLQSSPTLYKRRLLLLRQWNRRLFTPYLY